LHARSIFPAKLNDYRRFNTTSLSHLPIYLPDVARETKPEIDATDRQIDALVYEFYGLTDQEIAIVEEATRCWKSTNRITTSSRYSFGRRVTAARRFIDHKLLTNL